MTTTKRRKATTTYKTEKGNLIEAVRTNPEERSVSGRRYAVLVNGVEVGVITGGGGRYRFRGMTQDYLTGGSLDEGLLYAAACSLAGKGSL